ncbi:DUF2312 domain-containing protein [Brucella anthropi]|uniref:DUF2312 domain-containing protein n=1 Tax=Brucella anthropi TaxID=529 RepID=UPI003D9571D8
MSNSRLKSFIDRVLRLKEEEDTIKADIREVYAEMKGEGFDKTVAGQLVAHLRKVEKKGRDEVDNANAIFDLYLNEYENGTGLATHTHEEKSPNNSYADAKLIETVAAGMQTDVGRKALVAALDIMIEREEQGSSTVPQAPLSVDEKSRDAALPSVSAPSSGQE